MRIHRHWKVHLRGPGLLALAVLCYFSPRLLASVGYEFTFGDWVGYTMAAIALLSGVVLVFDSMQPYALLIHEYGITWTKGRRTSEFRWADVARVGFEPKPKETKPTVLTVWTPDAVRHPATPDVSRDGFHGYRVADTADVAEPVEQIDAVLRQYAGHLYSPAS